MARTAISDEEPTKKWKMIYGYAKLQNPRYANFFDIMKMICGKFKLKPKIALVWD